jgi:hypothetical protein
MPRTGRTTGKTFTARSGFSLKRPDPARDHLPLLLRSGASWHAQPAVSMRPATHTP